MINRKIFCKSGPRPSAAQQAKSMQTRFSLKLSQFTNTISDDITILHVNLTYEKLFIHCMMFCKLDVRRKSIVTLALS